MQERVTELESVIDGYAMQLVEPAKLERWDRMNTIQIKDIGSSLLILIPGTNGRFRVPLKDGKTISLGRANLPGMSSSVSSRHVEITRSQNQLLLRHLGSNPTLIHLRGHWWRLNETWIDPGAVAGANELVLKLADTDVKIVAENFTL